MNMLSWAIEMRDAFDECVELEKLNSGVQERKARVRVEIETQKNALARKSKENILEFQKKIEIYLFQKHFHTA